MGTLSFDGQFGKMRKAEDWIVYPMQDSTETIRIQSDHRFGIMDMATGKAVISARRAQYANSAWLQLCMMNQTAEAVLIEAEELQTLRQWIKSTGGIEVGRSFVKCDNTGAIAL
jgi:hypothetical protein